MVENITEKYGLKMFYDQFGNHVPMNFYDGGELPLILEFEKTALNLNTMFVDECNRILSET